MKSQFEKEAEYIIDESRGLGEGWTDKIFAVFPAFQSPNYQLYFIGQLISLIGTWLQTVAQGWLVLQLTNSAFWVGVVAAMAGLPTLFFALFGGVIVDRFEKKKILLFTQIAAMVLAIILGFLTILQLVNIPIIITLAFLLGLVTAVDIPARQAFVVEMVGREQLSSAIALNAGIFNGARVIGPTIAGFLIAAVGIGGAFIINGLSYIAVVIALVFMNVKEYIPKTHPHPLRAVQEGLVYAFTHPTIKILLIFTAVTSVFGWSYTTIMPVVAKHVYHLDVTGLGYLYAATGLGALLGAVIVSATAKKSNPVILILGGNSLFAISLILFSLTDNLILAFVLLFLAGLGLIAQFSTMNSTIQHLVSDHVRGRVMSIYALMFLGLTPLGSLQVGFLAEHFGSQFAIRLGAVVVLLFGMGIFFNLKKFNQSFK